MYLGGHLFENDKPGHVANYSTLLSTLSRFFLFLSLEKRKKEERKKKEECKWAFEKEKKGKENRTLAC